jgi:hypothetical protein
MLHSDVYNHGLPDEVKTAFTNCDVRFFHARIKELAARVAASDCTDEVLLSKLQIALALHDRIHTGGETLGFMADFINF